MNGKLYVGKDGKVGIRVEDEPIPEGATILMTPETDAERALISNLAHAAVQRRKTKKLAQSRVRKGAPIPPLPEDDWGHRR